jgi:hypothetical protein
MTSKPSRAGSGTRPSRSRWDLYAHAVDERDKAAGEAMGSLIKSATQVQQISRRAPKVLLKHSEQIGAYERESSGFSKAYASDRKYTRETRSIGLGLENRRGRESTVGSNPTPSAIYATIVLDFVVLH